MNLKLKPFFSFLLLLVFLLINGKNTQAQGLFSYFNWTAYSDGPEKVDHIIIDLNWTTLMDMPSSINQKYHRNIGAGAYLFHDHPMNKKSTLAWAVGVGFSSFNIHHNGIFVNQTLNNGNSYTNMVPLADSVNYRLNKHSLSFVEIPFELRIRSMKTSTEERKRSNFKVYLGFKAGYLFNIHSKYIDDGLKYKLYTFNNKLLYHYGPTLRIGFKKITLNAFYSLTPLFIEGRGVPISPFSVGISWMRL
jgi:hypothetical protein